MNRLRNYAFLLVILTFAFSAFAQKVEVKPAVQTSAALQSNLKLNSKLMAREMPYQVILPVNYDANKSEKFAVIYLLHGLTGHFDNWADKTKLKDYAANYRYIFVMPEGDNGWYTDSPTVANDKYESYIVQELIPEIDAKFRTISDRNHRVIAGLSMGGYGSLKFGLKYPEKFILVGSFSGALGAAGWTPKVLAATGAKGTLPDSVKTALGDEGSQTRTDNDIYKIVREITPEKMKNLPFMYVDCGTEDLLITFNKDFGNILLEKKIPHEFRELPGIHDWKFWDNSIKEFLEVSEKFVK